jgi:hypothetical protein
LSLGHLGYYKGRFKDELALTVLLQLRRLLRRPDRRRRWCRPESRPPPRRPSAVRTRRFPCDRTAQCTRPNAADVGAVEAVTFETVSGVPCAWSCASCATTCAIRTPILCVAPPSTACSGTVQLALSTEPIGIGDGPGDYANSASCTWVVSASGPITVRFSELSTEGCCDFVKLYDGTSSSAQLLGSYSGRAVPGPVASTGGALTIVFTSDSSNVGTGFAARLASASIDAALKVVGTVPAALGDLSCIGRITSMYVRPLSPRCCFLCSPP